MFRFPHLADWLGSIPFFSHVDVDGCGQRCVVTAGRILELQTKVCEDCTITEKAYATLNRH